MKTAISDLTGQLQPLSDDGTIARVLSLHNAGLQWPPGLDGKVAPKVYGFALKGLPGEALKRAVTRIIRGEVPTVTRYMPTPPELAALVRAEARDLYADRGRLLLALDSMETGKPMPERDQSAVDRVRQLVAGVKLAAIEARQNSGRGALPEEPASPEEVERLQKILDLPDVANVTAEHMAARRRASARIGEIPADVGQGRDFEGSDDA